MTRTNFDPPSEPPDGIPNCRLHDMPMEYDPGTKEWYCPNSHTRPVCPTCSCELDADGNCPECQERNVDVLTTVLGEEPYQAPDDQ